MTKHLLFPVFCTLLVFSALPASAQHAQPIRLELALFNPELVMRHADELGLDEAQRQAIHDEMLAGQEKFVALQNTLQQELAGMNELLKQNAVDEQKALAQLDKVLEAERQIKRAHLSLSLAIRGKLTAEQQARARELQEKLFSQERTAYAAPDALKEKMQRLSERMGRARQDGRDMSAIKPIMEEMQALMHNGKYKEAEGVMDRALKMMDEGEKK